MRAEEHLPPPTGRDLPPKGVSPGTTIWRTNIHNGLTLCIHLTDTANQFVERLTTFRNTSDTIGSGGHPQAPSPVHQQTHQTKPLPPAPESRTVIDRDPFAEPVTAGDTLTGATSKDVHRGIGVPAGGLTSKEVHHDGAAQRKRGMQGVEQFGNAGEVFEE